MGLKKKNEKKGWELPLILVPHTPKNDQKNYLQKLLESTSLLEFPMKNVSTIFGITMSFFFPFLFLASTYGPGSDILQDHK